MPAPLGHEAYNKDGEGGRPKKYTPAFIEKEAEALEQWIETKENVFLERFCLGRRYSPKLISEWVKENERFSEAHERLLTKQRVVLFEGGLSKKFGYPMCALILSNSHGIIAKSEQKLRGDAANPLAFLIKEIDGTSKELTNADQE